MGSARDPAGARLDGGHFHGTRNTYGKPSYLTNCKSYSCAGPYSCATPYAGNLLWVEVMETRIENGTLGVILGFDAIWNDTKCVDLANLIPNDLGELQAAVIKSIGAERSDSTLKRSFFELAGRNDRA